MRRLDALGKLRGRAVLGLGVGGRAAKLLVSTGLIKERRIIGVHLIHGCVRGGRRLGMVEMRSSRSRRPLSDPVARLAPAVLIKSGRAPRR